MSEQSRKPSNDATLDDSIALLKNKLAEADFNIVEHSYANPVSNVWSVQLHDNDCPLLISLGKGTSEKAALINALTKFIAHLSTHYYWADCYLGDEISNSKLLHSTNEKWLKAETNGSWPEGTLNKDLHDFYNPDGELNFSNLIDTNSSNIKRGICCKPFENIRSGEIVNFPINIIANLYSHNGIASALSAEEAQIKALSEIIGNYIKAKIIAEGISLPNIPEDALNRYPDFKIGINELKKAGYSLLIQDASFSGKYPVVIVTLLNPKTHGVSSSCGAHPDFEIALQQSLNNLLEGQNLDQLNDFVEAGFDMDEIASPQNLESHFKNSKGIISWHSLKDKPDFEFTDWDKQKSSNNHAETLKQLSHIINAEGNEIYIFEHDEIGVYSCQVIVPGISEVYPVDDLVWENNNAGINIRQQILKQNKTLEECETLIEDLEDLDLDDHHLISKLINMPADADSIFADLRVAELITLLALKTQDNERIQEGCEWLIHYQHINPHRLKTYQCINTILQLDNMTNYSDALTKLYTRPILNDALALIDGEDIFPLVSDWKTHKQMINAYKKLSKA